MVCMWSHQDRKFPRLTISERRKEAKEKKMIPMQLRLFKWETLTKQNLFYLLLLKSHLLEIWSVAVFYRIDWNYCWIVHHDSTVFVAYVFVYCVLCVVACSTHNHTVDYVYESRLDLELFWTVTTTFYSVIWFRCELKSSSATSSLR